MAFQSDLNPNMRNAAFLPRMDRMLRKRQPGQPGYLLRRIMRYMGVFLIWCAAIWFPIGTYLTSAPKKYTSQFSLILPGAGVSASVNIDDIGQASSYASSAFASNAVSPTQTYKRLIRADRILDVASAQLELPRNALSRPKVALVDQTGFINVEVTGPSPEDAKLRAQAVLDAFFVEVDALRKDDQLVREEGAVRAIEEYRSSVKSTRNAMTALQSETGFLSRDQFTSQVAENDTRYAKSIVLKGQLEEKTAYVNTMEQRLGLTADEAARALELYGDQGYISLIEDGALKASALAEANAKYGRRHPRLIDAKTSFEQAQQQIVQMASSITGLSPERVEILKLSQLGDRATLLAELVRNAAQLAGLEAQFATLNRRYVLERNRLEQSARAAATLEDLQRDFQVAEAVFASAIARAQSSKVDVFASYPLVQVLETPSLPEAPSSPRQKVALAAGIAATFMILMALSLGWVRRGVINWLIGMRSPQDE